MAAGLFQIFGDGHVGLLPAFAVVQQCLPDLSLSVRLWVHLDTFLDEIPGSESLCVYTFVRSGQTALQSGHAVLTPASSEGRGGSPNLATCDWT